MNIIKETTFNEAKLQCLTDYALTKGTDKKKNVTKRMICYLLMLAYSVLLLFMHEYRIAIFVVLADLFIIMLSQVILPKSYRKANADLIGMPSTVRFTDETVEETGPDHVYTWKWSAIKKVIEYEGYVLIFVGNNRILLMERELFTDEEMKQINGRVSELSSQLPVQTGEN